LRDSKVRVAVVADFAEEGWPSMDLVADSLFDRLRAEQAGEITPSLIRPLFRRRFSRGSGEHEGRGPTKFNLDRLLNRFIDYPRHLQRLRDNFDVFHITDHSYAHLAHYLAKGRVIVTCHDLDAFRVALEPTAKAGSRNEAATVPRGRWLVAGPLRLMAARQLRGLQSAAIVGCDSNATRDELLQHRLVAADRTVTIHNGAAEGFSQQPDPEADLEAARMLGPIGGNTLEILHVGSTIPRKRIDVLLQVFAAIREANPGARLVRVGGPFTIDQANLARELNVEDAIVVLPFVTTKALAAIYRRAVVVLITSEREGFGLPLIEAMACGAPVLASDLAVFREVGGEASQFAPVCDVPAFAAVAQRLIRERIDDPASWNRRRTDALAHAATFTWSEYARRYTELYRRVAAEAVQSST
jgi:glycosyltransferase involved in cell wall biosynthesis